MSAASFHGNAPPRPIPSLVDAAAAMTTTGDRIGVGAGDDVVAAEKTTTEWAGWGAAGVSGWLERAGSGNEGV